MRQLAEIARFPEPSGAPDGFRNVNSRKDARAGLPGRGSERDTTAVVQGAPLAERAEPRPPATS